MKYVRVVSEDSGIVMQWCDDDGVEDFAKVGDRIVFIIDSCDIVTGVLRRLNPVCFYVLLYESDHDVPFPVKHVTYISKS